MKPSQIFNVLDLTLNARKVNIQNNIDKDKFIPLFVGPPGIGKSEVIQQWCKKKGLPFIDIRAAYQEAPDMVGFPFLADVDGQKRTLRGTPDLWPISGEGVILLEEPNRGTTSVMNTFMQLLTDRKIEKYTLPPGWIVVAAINPEDDQHDVNTMDAALKNRFVPYEVTYDQEAFLSYAAHAEFDPRILNFIRGNFWHYTTPENVAANPGAKYISPRTFGQLDSALKAGLMEHDAMIQMITIEAILGKTYGVQFFNFISKERPVFVQDLIDNSHEALFRLKSFSDPKDYKNGHISLFVEDAKRSHKLLTDELLIAVTLSLPADQSVMLLREISHLRGAKPDELVNRLIDLNKKVKKYIQTNLSAK